MPCVVVVVTSCGRRSLTNIEMRFASLGLQHVLLHSSVVVECESKMYRNTETGCYSSMHIDLIAETALDTFRYAHVSDTLLLPREREFVTAATCCDSARGSRVALTRAHVRILLGAHHNNSHS